MLILRIRQAEIAMADGRLDEAYDLAQDARLRAHRRGQTLIGQLARALIERGRGHLAGERWAQAQRDCEKAAKLGGNLTEAAELRHAIAEAVANHQGQARRRADVLAAARKQLDEGRLSLCERMLAGATDSTSRVAMLAGRAAAARHAAAHHLDRALRVAEQGEWEAAVKHLHEARRHHAADRAVEDLAGRVTEALLAQVREAFSAGRLDRANRLLEQVVPLATAGGVVDEWRSAVLRCRQAMACLRRGAFRSAGEYLQRVAPLVGSAGWLAEAIESARQAAERVEKLRGGPLSLLADGADFEETSVETTAGAAAEQMTMDRPDDKLRPEPARDTVSAVPAGEPLPEQFMLHVDGAGSYLVVRKGCVTMGPISSPQRPDIGLLTEAGLPVVAFERIDEDYFVSADAPLLINNAPFTRKLLSDGDTLALSSRGRLKFALPNAASTTAVVRMAGLRLPCGDARQVILLDHTLVIGPGSAAHIRMDALAAPIVLHVHEGRLMCRSGPGVVVGDRPLGRGRGIPLDAHVRIDRVSLYMTELQQR